MTPRYQAAVLHAARGPLHIETVSAAPLAPFDVLARVGAAGLCHTDLEVIDGSLRYPMPIVLGHEGKQTMKARWAYSPRPIDASHSAMSFMQALAAHLERANMLARTRFERRG